MRILVMSLQMMISQAWVSQNQWLQHHGVNVHGGSAISNQPGDIVKQNKENHSDVTSDDDLPSTGVPEPMAPTSAINVNGESAIPNQPGDIGRQNEKNFSDVTSDDDLPSMGVPEPMAPTFGINVHGESAISSQPNDIGRQNEENHHRIYIPYNSYILVLRKYLYFLYSILSLSSFCFHGLIHSVFIGSYFCKEAYMKNENVQNHYFEKKSQHFRLVSVFKASKLFDKNTIALVLLTWVTRILLGNI